MTFQKIKNIVVSIMETTDSLQLNLKTDNQVTDNSNANKKRQFETDQEPVPENENNETIKYK